ncbi:hypothetical protein RB594_000919 [Gaeumannomyces avenae]
MMPNPKPPSPTTEGASNSINTAAGGNGPDEKPRLTEEEKKQNHIASEQKRRQAIREGFDRLTELVPGLEGQGRSEGIVLKRTVDFMRDQLEERRRLVQAIEERGGHVDDSVKNTPSTPRTSCGETVAEQNYGSARNPNDIYDTRPDLLWPRLSREALSLPSPLTLV